jgi:hypothetical protein
MRDPGFAILVAFALASCTVARGTDGDMDQRAGPGDGGERFDAACRFVPDGMVSYWFIDGIIITESDSILAKAGAGLLAIVCAARGFESVMVDRWSDPCRQIGVVISDHGRNLSPTALGWPALPDEYIAGQPIWHCSLFRGDPPESPILSAIADERFLIQARRELLSEALVARGNRHLLLQPFGSMPELDWSAQHLVFCLPRSDPPDHPGKGREGYAVFTGRENPWRVEGWYRDGKVRTADCFGDELPQRHAGDYVVRTKDLQKPRSHEELVRQARNNMRIAMASAYGFWFQ